MSAASHRSPTWRRLARGAVPFAGVALFVAALFVIRRELAAYGYREVVDEVRSLPASSLVAACLLTLVSYAVLTGVDTLAIRYATRTLAYRRIAFTSFIGYALSQALGTPLLTGAPIRYRLYSSWGLSTVDVTRVVAFNTVTHWVGLLIVLAGGFLFQPAQFATATSLPGGVARVLGALCSIGVVAYAAWALRSNRPLRVAAWEFPGPTRPVTAGQIVVGTADWLTVAGVLYVLLPAGHGLPFSAFVTVYAIAQVLAVVSHVPGGLGVFEAVLLVMMPESVSDGGIVASLLAFRCIYYFLPLLTAAGALGLYEVRQRKEALERTVDVVGKGVSTAVPLILSGVVFLAGVSLLLTGALPVPDGQLAWLGRILPLPVIELSHFLGSVLGGGLLILGWSLRQRLEIAYRLTVVVVAVGVALTVTRGMALAQGVYLLVVLGALLTARREFFREASLTAELPSPDWLLLVGMTLAGLVWLGLYVYPRVDLSAELWWEFALRGDAPRFLRASVGAAVLLLSYGLARLLRPTVPGELSEGPGTLPPEVDAVLGASDRAHAALVYLGDKQVLLSKSGHALIMYGVERRSWVSLGDPLGDPAHHDELLWRFRKLAFRYGGWPVFYQVRPPFLPLYVDAGLTATKLGEEAYVPLDSFSLEGGDRRNLRRTVRKVEAEGVSFEMLPPEAVGPVLPELRNVSDAWLEEKSAKEKGFSMGFFKDDYLVRTPVVVLKRDGRIVAFANVLASGDRTELSADLMRYGSGSPSSAMEYLFIRLMLWGSAAGYRRFSLGMAPLSGLDTRPLAPLWNRLGTAVFRYGEHFYNFQGLRAYKEKFDPAWEARYLVSPGGLAFPRVLAHVAALIGGGVRGIVVR